MYKEKIGFIAGAGSGLGKGINNYLSNEGLTTFPACHKEFGDFRNFSNIDSAVQCCLQKYERLDFFVHCIGPFVRKRKHFVDYDLEELQEVIEGNLTHTLYFLKNIIPIMRKQKFGRIILFGFARVDENPPWPDRAIYAASKSALASLVRSLSVEEAPFGITINMICPGDIVGVHKELTIEQVKKMPANEEIPIGRSGSGEDIARIVNVLLKDKSEFITGSFFNVTGGLDVINTISKA